MWPSRDKEITSSLAFGLTFYICMLLVWCLQSCSIRKKIRKFPRLTYKMKDETNTKISFPQRLKKYSLTLYTVQNDLKMLKAKREISNSKRVKKILGTLHPPIGLYLVPAGWLTASVRPPAEFYRDSIFYTKND